MTYTPAYFFRIALFSLVLLNTHSVLYAQSGIKWATNGNSVSSGDFIGSTNSASLFFRTANIQRASISSGGVFQVNNLAGTGSGFVALDASGNLVRTDFNGSATSFLGADGTFHSLATSGGWVTSGSDIYNPNSGGVAIGTNSISYGNIFEVNGNMRVDGVVTAMGVVIANKLQADTVKGGSALVVNNNMNISGGVLNEIYAFSGDVRLQSRPGFNGNLILGAGTNSNIGIGNYNPSFKLDIIGDCKLNGDLYTKRVRPLPGDTAVIIGDSSIWISTSNKIFIYGTNVTYRGIAMGSVYSSAYGIGSLAFGSHVWTASNADYAIVMGSGPTSGGSLKNDIQHSLMVGFNSNIPSFFVGPSAGSNTVGKVGVGTKNPQGAFQVGDNELSVNMGAAPNVGTTYSFAYFGLNAARDNATQSWTFQNNGPANGGVALLTSANGDLEVMTVKASGAANQNQVISDAAMEQYNIFEIRSNGKVMIGPNANELQAPGNYRLYVRDGILSEHVKVSSYGNWSDFVFDSAYYLQPLDSVNQFIAVNHHLEGIPSAKEVQENGIDMADMDAALLAKVEELTLYMIKMQKEMDELKKQNQELENRLDQK